MTLIHITDPHFEFLPAERIEAFGREVRAAYSDSNAEAIFITGDVSTATRCERDMRAFYAGLGEGLPVYAVRGNHDFYGSSIAEVNRLHHGTGEGNDFGALDEPLVAFNSAAGGLRDGAWFVCVDGWYDFRCGREERTRIEMSDWHMIADFRGLSRAKIVEASRLLAEQSAKRAIEALTFGLDYDAGTKRMVLATHVPPFLECALAPDGRPSDPDWAPIMVNVALGDALFAFAAEHPEVDLLVLCGHTHTACDRRVLPN